MLIGLVSLVACRSHDLGPNPVRLVYEVDVAHRYDQKRSTAETLSRAAEMVRNRLDRLDLVAVVSTSGDRIELKTRRDPSSLDRVKKLLARPARLELKAVEEDSAFMATVSERAKQLGGATQAALVEDEWSGRDDKLHHDRYLAADSTAAIDATFAQLGAALPADHQVLYERSELDGRGARWRSYYVRRAFVIDNDDIVDADIAHDSQTGRPEVNITLGARGARAFEDFSAGWVGHKLAIILDDQVMSAPMIMSRISGGRLRVTLGGSGNLAEIERDGRDLVAVLRVGGLPAPLRLLEEGIAPP
jgi:preprotein translocase subunit SecD